MPANIKAVVFKTPQLKASRVFFETVLKLPVNESSAKHFVIYSKRLRLVFVESISDFEVEIYVNDKMKNLAPESLADLTIPGFENYKDPNGIRVIITRQEIKRQK
jgi:hypothetical protein